MACGLCPIAPLSETNKVPSPAEEARRQAEVDAAAAAAALTRLETEVEVLRAEAEAARKAAAAAEAEAARQVELARKAAAEAEAARQAEAVRKAADEAEAARKAAEAEATMKAADEAEVARKAADEAEAARKDPLLLLVGIYQWSQSHPAASFFLSCSVLMLMSVPVSIYRRKTRPSCVSPAEVMGIRRHSALLDNYTRRLVRLPVDAARHSPRSSPEPAIVAARRRGPRPGPAQESTM
jgi:hypothetical protein